MKLSEREETTKYANNIVSSYLKKKEYTSALLLASIYVNIRLKSLLTDRLSPSKSKWRSVSKKLNFSFNNLLDRCNRLGISKKYDFNPKYLKKLWKMRCSIAQESKLWKKLSEKDEENIEELCLSAKAFLEKTKNMQACEK